MSRKWRNWYQNEVDEEIRELIDDLVWLSKVSQKIKKEI